MYKKILLIVAFAFLSQTAGAINFGGVTGRLGREIEKLNPFSSTPESRADDFYKNAETKVFDCRLGTAWFTLVDGYLTMENRMIGQVKKLSLDRQLLVRLNTTNANFTCSISGESWITDDGVREMTPCKVGNEGLFLCKRRK